MKMAFQLFCLFSFFSYSSNAQNPVNWTKGQLLEPAELAKNLLAEKGVPLIFSVGPGASIPHSIAIGTASDKVNLENFEKQLIPLSKDESIVVYCGCCPFEHCPNVRPAIDLLKKLHFTNYKLLNLSHNLKADWIDKGYPVVK